MQNVYSIQRKIIWTIYIAPKCHIVQQIVYKEIIVSPQLVKAIFMLQVNNRISVFNIIIFHVTLLIANTKLKTEWLWIRKAKGYYFLRYWVILYQIHGLYEVEWQEIYKS